MTLGAGARLGPYEIISPLGSGGMGEVYKARDTRLDRIVAVKVLPEALAADPQFRERFDREARTISQLDHPNICALYDVGDQDGVAFLVMQFLEGETLADRLTAKMGVDEALRIAVQIADALDRAHRAGIVHRDLKPANIFLARAGASSPPVAKLLDFGLAKTAGPAVGVASGTMLPTTPVNITAQGTILGTFQYMAPEQLEGGDADARTDIFAFGAVVYEMVTGRKAFEGKSQVSLIGAILEREPASITTLAPAAPPALDRIVKRCLAKDPDRRWQTASDLAHELRWVAETPQPSVTPSSSTVAEPSSKSRSRSARWWKVATAAFAMVAAAGLWAAYAARSVTPQVVRFFIDAPDKTSFVSGGRTGASAAISPDGRRLAFTVQDSARKVSLWVRPIDALTAQPLPGTDDASFPFWSPDSRWIAYFTRNKLMKIDAGGGPAQTLCDAPDGRGGAWSRDGVIIFGDRGGPLKRVSSNGGQPQPITTPGASEADHRFPSFLPDGQHFLFFGNVIQTTPLANGVFLGSLDSKETRRIVDAESSAVYSSGYLLFVRQGTLFAQSFDPKALILSGDAFPVAERVTRNYGGIIAFSASNDGVLAYGIGPGGLGGGVNVVLTWVDRQGKTIGTFGSPAPYRGIDLSPDGKRVAAHRHDTPGGDIWILDGARSERFTFEPLAENESPLWSPDGEWITFAARRGGKSGVYRKRSNNTGTEELLFESPAVMAPTSWSPDGQSIVYVTSVPPGHLFTLSLKMPRTPMRTTSAGAPGALSETRGQVSPNGKWLAYQTQDAATTRPEIYVQPFGGGPEKYQISTNGGMYPRWRGDGRELFYFDQTGGPPVSGKVMAVEIGPSVSSLERGAPTPLFDALYFNFQHQPGIVYHPFAVSRDGQRFLIPRAESVPSETAADSPVVVVLNWASALERK